MDVRVVGVPGIDGHPVEPRAEIGLHLPGQIAGEGLEIRHVAGVLWRDDEPEMMPVLLAPPCKSRAVSAVAAGIEHLGSLTTPGHAVALQIREMRRQWC